MLIIRIVLGITIAQICEGTGLSKGFMSQVENNKTSPSISTLETISNFLNVPLPYLLLEQKDRLKIVKKEERKYSVYGKDEQRIEHVAEQGGLRLSLVEIPTGFPKENSPNAHEGEECHLVLRGKLEVQHGEDIAKFLITFDKIHNWHESHRAQQQAQRSAALTPCRQ